MTITPLEDPDEPIDSIELAIVLLCGIVATVAQLIRNMRAPPKMHVF